MKFNMIGYGRLIADVVSHKNSITVSYRGSNVREATINTNNKNYKNQDNVQQKLKTRTVHRAVLTALPILAVASFNTYAACTTGSSPTTDANTVTCTEGSTYTNAAGTSVTNTATISAGNPTTSAVQMTGNGSNFNNAGTLSNTSSYTNTGVNAGQKFGAYIAAPTATIDLLNTITNSGSISAIISDDNMQLNKARLNTAAVVGLGTDAEAEYELTNSGSISATHNGVGRVNGIEAGGDVEEMLITNSGVIIGTQSHAITITTSTATSFQGTVVLGDSTSTAPANIGVAAGIYAEEEVQELGVTNTGTITGVGTYASGIYTRAAKTEIENEGTITGTKIGIAHVSDSGEIRTLELENSGTINGDILSVNGSALRWWSLSNGEGTGGANIDSRLAISSQIGQADSQIENSGTINGNLYYSNGTHTLNNTSSGIIAGDIDLDQRNMTSAAGAGIIGTKQFSFENAGSFSGNITVRTATGSAITLIPTITGSGVGSTVDAPSANIAGMGSVLKVFDGTAVSDGSNSTANLVTVAPKSLVTVHTGEYFKVADNLYGATLPEVSSASTPLVNWILTKNTGGNLVLGVDSVNSAATVAGVSSTSATIIDALLTSNTVVGGAVQSLTDATELEKAGKQLSPEKNGGAYAGAQVATGQFSNLISARLDSNQGGASGVSTGDAALANGLWFQGFGFTGEQDKRKNADGYDADTAGFAVGYDRDINDDLRLGFAGAYATTSVDANNTTKGNTTDIDSYQASVYGTYSFKDWYLDGQIGYAKHKFDSKRLVSVPVTDVAKGSFDADQYMVKVGANFPIKTSANLTLIPTIAAAYSYFDQDDYTERSNNGTGLSIKGKNTDSFRTGLGGKALWSLGDASMPVMLEARALWWHEFNDVRQDTTARFAAGGSTFHVDGVKPERDSGNIGLTVSASAKDASQVLSLSYDAEIRDQYIGHTGSITARFNF